MRNRDSGTERQPPFRWSRAYAPAALALAVVLVAVFTTVFFTTAGSRADGPPDLGTAFTLPFKLEQGRQAPARSSSVPKQAGTPAAPTPAATPGATPESVAPSTPPNVNAYPVAHSVIEIRWGQPEGEVDGFELQVSADGGSTWQLLAGRSVLRDSSGRLYTWSQQYGLQRNQTRHYRVRAGNGNAWSAWSDAVSSTTFSTSSPRLSVEAPDKFSLKITWEMPSVYVTITGWTLEMTADAPAQSNRNWTRLSSTLAAEERTYTHSGLQPGDTRYYRIRANTDVGTPQWSRVSHESTLLGPPPAAPRLSARANGATEIVLSWNEPDDRGFAITRYLLEHSPDGKDWRYLDASLSDPGGITTYSQIVFIDEPGTTRYYRIRARSVNGLGPWSQPARATTENGGAGAPTGLKVVDFGATWVKLTWQPPEQKGADITGYQVQRSEEGEDYTTVWRNAGSTTVSKRVFEDVGLEPGSHHQYRVAARDSGGLGPWGTDFVDVRTNFLARTAPRLTARAAERDNGEDLPSHSRYQAWIEFNWTEVSIGSPFAPWYALEWSSNGRDDWERETFTDQEGEHWDPEFGETRYYRVAVLDDQKTGPWSNVVKVTTRAVPPRQLPFMSARPIKANEIKINWGPPDEDGGSRVTGYQIQVSTEGYLDDSNFKTVATPSDSAEDYTHRGLKPDTEYCYRYRARNSAGWSVWQRGPRAGRDQCFRTTPLAPATPSLTVAPSGTEGVRLSWTQPAKPGATFTSFEISLSHDSATWRFATTQVSSSRHMIITYQAIRHHYREDEQPPTIYFRVRTLGPGGESDWSQARSIALPAE